MNQDKTFRKVLYALLYKEKAIFIPESPEHNVLPGRENEEIIDILMRMVPSGYLKLVSFENLRFFVVTPLGNCFFQRNSGQNQHEMSIITERTEITDEDCSSIYTLRTRDSWQGPPVSNFIGISPFRVCASPNSTCRPVLRDDNYCFE